MLAARAVVAMWALAKEAKVVEAPAAAVKAVAVEAEVGRAEDRAVRAAKAAAAVRFPLIRNR